MKATAGYAITADEQVPNINPKLIVRETLKAYNKTLKSLINQGYSQNLAETIAMKYMLEDE